MSRKKQIADIIFFMCVISVPVSFWISSVVGESNIFGVGGIVRYSWIMWLFIPINIVSYILGLYLKKCGEKYKSNQIVAFICVPILLIFGSYRFLGFDVNYDTSIISDLEHNIDFDLPNDVKVVNESNTDYYVSRVKILDNEEKELFEKDIDESKKWTTTPNSLLSSSLPYLIETETTEFDYFMFYNNTQKTYNSYPNSNGEFDYIFIAYDLENSRFIILTHYMIKVQN